MRATGFFVLTLLATAPALRGQESTWNRGHSGMTRAELQEIRARYEAAARSLAYSAELRARARTEAEATRRRLVEGDFRTGDRIVLTVQGEPALSDTFLVTTDRAIQLPTLGDVSLRGVLRSELETYLTEQLRQLINDPVAYARSYLRISVTGAVSAPGYYLIPAEMPVADAIMLVGGPAPEADLSRTRIYRGREETWSGEALWAAIRGGSTLDELNMREGDEIVVGRRSLFSPAELGRTLLYVSGTLVAVSTFLRILR